MQPNNSLHLTWLSCGKGRVPRPQECARMNGVLTFPLPLNHSRCHSRNGVVSFFQREDYRLLMRPQLRPERQDFFHRSQPVRELWIQGHTLQLVANTQPHQVITYELWVGHVHPLIFLYPPSPHPEAADHSSHPCSAFTTDQIPMQSPLPQSFLIDSIRPISCIISLSGTCRGLDCCQLHHLFPKQFPDIP